MTTFTIVSGETAFGFNLNSGDVMNVLSGGTAITTTANLGAFYVLSGTSAARRVTLALPPIQTAADVITALAEVVSIMARGEITPDEAATIGGVIELQRKSIDTEDVERRLIALENAGEN